MSLKSADTYACPPPLLECLLLSQGEIRGGGLQEDAAPLEDSAPPPPGRSRHETLTRPQPSRSPDPSKNAVRRSDSEVALRHAKVCSETERKHGHGATTRAVISPGHHCPHGGETAVETSCRFECFTNCSSAGILLYQRRDLLSRVYRGGEKQKAAPPSHTHTPGPQPPRKMAQGSEVRNGAHFLLMRLEKAAQVRGGHKENPPLCWETLKKDVFVETNEKNLMCGKSMKSDLTDLG